MTRFEIERRRLGLTQKELAAKVGMSKMEISYIERGKVVPKPRTSKLFADLFGVDAAELFGWEVDDKEENKEE